MVQSKIAKIELKTSPIIIHQPQDISVCQGSDIEIPIVAMGSELTYQWYFNNKLIAGATSSDFKIQNADREENKGKYKVELRGVCGTPVISDDVSVRIANPISESDLVIDSISDEVVANRQYKMQIGYSFGFEDVINYKWSYSNSNICFFREEGADLFNTFAEFDLNDKSGILKVELEHVCGPT